MFNQIEKQDLERAAAEWALDQIKPYGDAKVAAEKFFEFRMAFIEAYRKVEGK